MSGPEPANRRILELDGLRAISVFFVLIAHSAGAAALYHVPAALYPEVTNLGAFGVQIFFVISGFIITRLQIDEIEATGRLSFLQFYIRRFFRIIPAYWTFLLVILLLALVGEISLNGHCVTLALLFISNFHWYPFLEGWFCGHTWTLSVEEQYYVTFPFLMWVIFRGNRKWILITLCLLYLFSVYSGKLGKFDARLNLGFFSEYKYIVVGVAMALLWERLIGLLKGISIVLPLVLVIFLFARPLISLLHVVDTYFVMPVEALATSLLIAWVIQNPAPCAFLRNQVLQWLGKCSYSIYLWQQLFTGPAYLYRNVRLSNLLYGPVLLLLCVCASYYLIERPSIRLGRQLCSQVKARRHAKKSTILSENVKVIP